MRLVKFRTNSKLMVVIACFLFVIVIFLSLIFYFKSYAVFREEKHFNVINGIVGDLGDIYFAYYVDDEITRSIPKKGSGYTLDLEKSNCTNGVSISFDENNYAVITSYENYNATDYTRTRCDLYFKKLDITLSDYIKSLALYNSTDLTLDEAGGNIRYIGADPNNYVLVDGELWRIIGVMKNIDDGTGSKSDRVKLIRNESIGAYSWDSSESSINDGKGVNEWSQADLMKLLNPGYESESIDGSLYWNSKSGNCYNGINNQTFICDFSSFGIKNELKGMIDDTLWNLGANDSTKTKYSETYTTLLYEFERGNHTGKICTNFSFCNDTVVRTTTWIGKVGLMYPSDYGYATNMPDAFIRSECLKTPYNNSSSTFAVCISSNWLYDANAYHFLNPVEDSYPNNDAYHIFTLFSDGSIGSIPSSTPLSVKPVVYLKPTVKIVSGIGTKENPFVIRN